MNLYLPEALYPAQPFSIETDQIYAGRAVRCDAARNLIVEWAGQKGFIPRGEAAASLGKGEVRDIALLSLVGKQICFVVTGFPRTPEAPFLLSRRRAQERAAEHLLSSLSPGQIIPAVVTHLASFGAFVDIGCGFSSMLPIERISVSRISHPKDRFTVGQPLRVLVTELQPERRRVLLSHRELLGTWEENAADFAAGDTVPGIVRGLRDYGVFVELTPNLAGLADLYPDLCEGDGVSVYIKSLSVERMKLKLHVIERLPSAAAPPPPAYFIREDRLDSWRYAPEHTKKQSAVFFAGERTPDGR